MIIKKHIKNELNKEAKLKDEIRQDRKESNLIYLPTFVTLVYSQDGELRKPCSVSSAIRILEDPEVSLKIKIKRAKDRLQSFRIATEEARKSPNICF
jgi:hypothetical protein